MRYQLHAAHVLVERQLNESIHRGEFGHGHDEPGTQVDQRAAGAGLIGIFPGVVFDMAGVDLDEGDANFAPSKFVVTDIRAGMEVTNVTPGKLKLMFNVRNSTKTDRKAIEDFVHKYFSEMNYTLRLEQSAYPFMTDPNTKIVRTIDAAIKKVTGIKPKHSTAGGTSDARYIAPYGVDVIEFGVRNDTIHAPNERTTREEVEKLCAVFKEVIASF